jgi:hypothetical protein
MLTARYVDLVLYLKEASNTGTATSLFKEEEAAGVAGWIRVMMSVFLASHRPRGHGRIIVEGLRQAFAFCRKPLADMLQNTWLSAGSGHLLVSRMLTPSGVYI